MFRRSPAHALVLLACVMWLGSKGLCLTVTNVSPSDYQIAPLTEGVTYYTDAPHTISSIPLAMTDGTLIRTEAADASNPGLAVSFETDVRAEVYVCCDSRYPAPSWLSSWVATDMTVGVTDGMVGSYKVYAKRFDAGTVQLSANQAGEMYFVVAKESLPKLPRNGWVLLTYDMPYLREIIKKAPEYDINMIQISHDLMMNTWEVLDQSTRRANINELISLAHAYGVTEVALWTHEICTRGMPTEYQAPAGHPAAGHADGNNPAMWEWLRDRYVRLFSPATGCPEADAIVLTFSEVDDNVYEHQGDGNPGLPPGAKPSFKHDGYTQQESVAMLIDNVQQVCEQFGARLYARTWDCFVDHWAHPVIRDGILVNGDTRVWIMNKNMDPGPGADFMNMDTYAPLIGTLPPEFNELVEFDLIFEVRGQGRTTGCMTSYLKEHWNYGLACGADGAVARIDREGGFSYYSPNRINLYAFKEVLANPDVDPLAVNLAWCQQHFPPGVAEDVAAYYDDPYSPYEGDTRYVMWEGYFPGLCPLSVPEVLDIGYKALARIYPHKAALMAQTTLKTRDGINDYDALCSGIMTGISRLGGVTPEFVPPSVPTNIQAFGTSPTNIGLTWTAATDNVAVTGYKIYRDGIFVGASPTTSYTDAGLAPMSTHSYTVSAYDAFQNNSAQSSPPAAATGLAGTDTSAPSVPANVVAEGNSIDSINVTWAASTDNSGVVGYRIRRNGLLAGTSVSTSFVDTGLSYETTYSYTVSAYDAAGNESAPSSPATAVTLPGVTIPDAVAISNVAPSNYVVTTFDLGSLTFIDRTYVITSMPTKYRGIQGIRTSNNNKENPTLDFHFTIDRPSDIYVVLRDTLVPITPLLSGFVDTGDIVVNTDLQPYPFYKVWRKPYPAGVVSLGPKPNAGDGNSTFYVFVRALDSDSPSVPTNVVATPQSAASVHIAWSASSDNTGTAGYKVYRNGAFVGAAAGTSYVDDGLAPLTTYSYTVSAFDVTGNQSAQSSPAATATTLESPDTTAPSVPVGVTAVTQSPTSIFVSWTASTDDVAVAGYKVYRNGAQINSLQITSYTDTDLTPSTTYSYTISAYDYAANESAQSSPPAVATTMPPDVQPPSVPTNVQAAGISGIEIQVTWTASTDDIGVKGYQVYRNGVQIADCTSPSYTDTGLLAYTLYSYTVSAYDAAGNVSSQSSPPATATTTTELVISEVVPDMYQVTNWNVGSLLFIDRTYTIRSMPTKYSGLLGVRTANSDKDKPNLDFHFTINQAATIYVCLAEDTQPTTPLMAGFVSTGDIVDTTDQKYGIFQKVYPAGVVNLGPKPGAGNQRSMYFVFAEPYPDTEPPGVPTNVIAAAQSQTAIQIIWDASSDNVGVTGYKLFRNGAEVATSAFTSYTDSGLAAGTTYSYTVSACDGAGNDSGQSSPPAVATTFSKVDIDIAAAKQQGDGTLVTVSGKVVTAIFATCLYIEEPDKFSGIRVVPLEMPADIEVNEVVNVSGTIRTEMGQRYIDGASVTSTVGGN